jgi:integrase
MAMAVNRRGKTWYIDYYFEGRRIREVVGPSRKIAQIALDARRGEIAQGRFELRKIKTSPLFKDFAKDYLEWAKANKSSWISDRTALNHLVPFFGSMRMHQISPFLIEKYKREKLKGTIAGRPVKPATVNRQLSILRRMYNIALKWGKVEFNPMTGVNFFREEVDTFRFLSLEEIDLMLEYASDHLRPILIVALNTGMRRGEILNLRWEHIDFELKTITVRHTKNKEFRIIPMNDRLTKTLDKIKIMSTRKGYVFCHDDGKPYGTVRTSFENLRQKLKQIGVPHFRFHDLRHTFASHLVMSGADLVVVKELLGHKTLAMTMRYSHLSDEHKRNALKNIYSHKSVTNVVSIKPETA